MKNDDILQDYDSERKLVERTTIQEVDSYEVGDKFRFTLKNGEVMWAIAVKKDVDGMEFIFIDCLATNYSMKSLDISLRAYLKRDILDLIPDNLLKNMKKFTNGAYLRLATEKEIFGENKLGVREPDNIVQFEPMKMLRNRISFQRDDGMKYWLQNSVNDFNKYSVCVSAHGRVCYANISQYHGVRPCFKL